MRTTAVGVRNDSLYKSSCCRHQLRHVRDHLKARQCGLLCTSGQYFRTPRSFEGALSVQLGDIEFVHLTGLQICTDIYPIEDFDNTNTDTTSASYKASAGLLSRHASVRPVKLRGDKQHTVSCCPCSPYTCIHGVHLPKADELKCELNRGFLANVFQWTRSIGIPAHCRWRMRVWRTHSRSPASCSTCPASTLCTQTLSCTNARTQGTFVCTHVWRICRYELICVRAPNAAARNQFVYAVSSLAHASQHRHMPGST